MPKDTVELKGLKDLERQMRNLTLAKSRTAIGRALREGAAIVRKDARRRAPRRTGLLRRSIRTVTVRENRKVNVGIVVRAPKGGRKPFYWRVLEYGTGERRRGRRENKGKGGRTGAVSPQPFLRPAFDNNHKTVATVIERRLGEEIDTQIRKGR